MPQKPRELSTLRIVSLAPNVTAILLALGVTRELVGVSKWCRHVANVGGRPEVGDCWKLSIPAVMRLKPTLLIGSVPFAAATVTQILEESVAFLAINPRSLVDIETDIRTLGRLANRSAGDEKLVRHMQIEFANVAERAAALCQKPKPRVYCEAWPNPRISSPPWVDEMIHIAGGIAVVPAGARVTDEQVAKAKPDVIVLAWTATNDRAKPESTLRNPLWQGLPAVKLKRVTVIRDELLNTPGPPLMHGIESLFRAIHPAQSGERQKTKVDGL